jgi:hypothetical protein
VRSRRLGKRGWAQKPISANTATAAKNCHGWSLTLIVREQGNIIAKNRELLAKQANRTHLPR